MVTAKIFLAAAVVVVLASGTAYGLGPIFTTDVEIPSGNSFKLGDFAISMARTDPTGAAPGNDLNLRGFNGISMRTGGDANFGTGTEIMRVGPGGVENLQMATGKAVFFVDHGISVARTDSAGTAAGNYMNIRGFDGVVMRTGGDGLFGTGDEQFRMGQSGVQSMTMAPGGSITSTGDICIGAC